MPDTSKVVSFAIEFIMAKETEHGFESLTPLQQIVFVVTDLDSTVMIEGLFGYYDCRAGQRAVQAADALYMIGAHESAKIIRLVNAQFPSHVPPSEWEERRKILWSLDDVAAETIERMGERDAEYPDDLRDKFEAFVWENHDELTV